MEELEMALRRRVAEARTRESRGRSSQSLQSMTPYLVLDGVESRLRSGREIRGRRRSDGQLVKCTMPIKEPTWDKPERMGTLGRGGVGDGVETSGGGGADKRVYRATPP